MNKDLLKKRYKKEKRFILIGRIAVSLTIIFLVILLGSIILRGISGFYTTNISLKTTLSEEIIDPNKSKNIDEIFKASWRKVSRTAIYNILDEYNGLDQYDQVGHSVKQTSDGGYIISGYEFSWDDNIWDLSLIHI